MAKITPKLIVERHTEWPDATEQLIESYAFSEYKKAINDLMRFGQIVKVENTNVTMIVLSNSDYEQWKSLELSHWYLNKTDEVK